MTTAKKTIKICDFNGSSSLASPERELTEQKLWKNCNIACTGNTNPLLTYKKLLKMAQSKQWIYPFIAW